MLYKLLKLKSKDLCRAAPDLEETRAPSRRVSSHRASMAPQIAHIECHRCDPSMKFRQHEREPDPGSDAAAGLREDATGRRSHNGSNCCLCLPTLDLRWTERTHAIHTCLQ